MTEAELKRQVEEDITDTKRRLIGWIDQAGMQVGTPLHPHVVRIVESYGEQLNGLKEALRLFDA